MTVGTSGAVAGGVTCSGGSPQLGYPRAFRKSKKAVFLPTKENAFFDSFFRAGSARRWSSFDLDLSRVGPDQNLQRHSGSEGVNPVLRLALSSRLADFNGVRHSPAKMRLEGLAAFLLKGNGRSDTLSGLGNFIFTSR